MSVDEILTIDRQVDHTSLVPAIAGEPTRLFVREKAAASLLAADGGRVGEDRVVLMVHGGFSPVELAFDFTYPVFGDEAPYSWMEALARAGFDVFAMNLTGYGASSRPLMGDPGNLSPEHQALMDAETLPEPRPPSYPYKLVTSESEAADIDRVVDMIRSLRDVERVNLIGWSGGGIRTGTYTVRHPEKVARLVIWASSNYADDGRDGPPAELPEPGYPIMFQDRATAEAVRWRPNVKREGQVAPGVLDAVWQQTCAADPLGAAWGPGGLRAPSRSYWGWNARAAAAIRCPTLVMVGEYDRLMSSNRALHAALGSEEKVFLAIDGGSHFMAWEKQRRILHRASIAWLGEGAVAGKSRGVFRVDYEGGFAAEDAA
ncbi:MAG: alpha/beta fold hydrolase [Alphaproteobacteria bacterium]|nr:alpha/beta fold hydrolase [Alphaproteobacteria bacterium]